MLDTFRENAERYEQLARDAGSNITTRKWLLDIAERWRKLAEDMEAQAKQSTVNGPTHRNREP